MFLSQMIYTQWNNTLLREYIKFYNFFFNEVQVYKGQSKVPLKNGSFKNQLETLFKNQNTFQRINWTEPTFLQKKLIFVWFNEKTLTATASDLSLNTSGDSICWE